MIIAESSGGMTVNQFCDLTEAQIVYLSEATRSLKLSKMEFDANIHGREMKRQQETPKLSSKQAKTLDSISEKGFNVLFN